MSQFREKCVTENLHKSANFPINLYQTINSPCYYSAPRPFNFLEIVKFVKGTVVAIREPPSPFMGQQFLNLNVSTQGNSVFGAKTQRTLPIGLISRQLFSHQCCPLSEVLYINNPAHFWKLCSKYKYCHDENSFFIPASIIFR